MNAFLHTVEERVRAGSRVFVVERGAIAEEQRPPELQELRGYRFWVVDRAGRPPRILGEPRPTPDDVRYYDVLNDLSCDFAEELQRLRATAAQRTTAIPVAVPGEPALEAHPTVFLAEVTDDLDAQRDDVQRYLTQASLRVLPEIWYPREPMAFQQALDKDLAQSALFVQLLSGIPGRKAPDVPHGYPRLQFDRARELRKPILQWRSPELDLTTIREADHRVFLGGEAVLAVRIEECKHTIVQRVHAKPALSPQRSINALVFVDAEKEDDALAQAVGEFLARHGIASVFPLREGSPAEMRQDFEQNLLDCDAVIVIYGGIHLPWVRGQLVYCLKLTSRREQPFKALAVYEGPPEPKTPLSVMIPNLRMIDCRSGLHAQALQTLIEALKG